MNDRRDDWERGVDENLASLNTGQRVNDRILEDLDKNYAALDHVLRGDAEKDTDGLIAQVHEIQTKLARVNAILFVDSTGKKGLQHEVESLLSGERTASERWKFATAVVVAFLSLVGLLITNWGRISGFLEAQDKDPVDQAIESAKHRHIKHIILHPVSEEE